MSIGDFPLNSSQIFHRKHIHHLAGMLRERVAKAAFFAFNENPTNTFPSFTQFSQLTVDMFYSSDLFVLMNKHPLQDCILKPFTFTGNVLSVSELSTFSGQKNDVKFVIYETEFYVMVDGAWRRDGDKVRVPILVNVKKVLGRIMSEIEAFVLMGPFSPIDGDGTSIIGAVSGFQLPNLSEGIGLGDNQYITAILISSYNLTQRGIIEGYTRTGDGFVFKILGNGHVQESLNPPLTSPFVRYPHTTMFQDEELPVTPDGDFLSLFNGLQNVFSVQDKGVDSYWDDFTLIQHLIYPNLNEKDSYPLYHQILNYLYYLIREKKFLEPNHGVTTTVNPTIIIFGCGIPECSPCNTGTTQGFTYPVPYNIVYTMTTQFPSFIAFCNTCLCLYDQFSFAVFADVSQSFILI